MSSDSLQTEAAGGAFTGPPALAFENLSKTFGGQKALDGASLSVATGEVHGLLGQNGSGKSTLIKVLAGFHEPDPGAVLRIAGEPVPLPIPPGNFRRHRISFVHQHLGLIPSLSVLDNLMIGRLADRPNWGISWGREARRAEALFARYGVALDPRTDVLRLSPVERALLAIVRAVDEMEQGGEANGAGVLVLDEPTPFLPKRDVDRLFTVMRTIVAQGASVIFVSHDVDEVMEITDRATILRDGRVAGTLVTRQANKADFIEKIVGRKFVAFAKAELGDARQTGMTVSGLTGRGVAEFSVTARRGEVIGLTGLVGSGYATVPYLLYGAQRAENGMLDLGDGAEISLGEMSPAKAIERGVVLIPGDRANAAAIGPLPISDNVTMPVLATVFNRWRLTRGRMVSLAEDLGRQFEVLPNRPDLPINALSGGNQQKVMLAKWLQQSPRLVLLDEPTQGVDIGARQAVFAQIEKVTRSGASVLCASSDYEQLEAICDRVLIFAAGRVIAELRGAAINKAAIAENCYGGAEAQQEAAA